MQFILINTAEKKLLEQFTIDMHLAGIVLHRKYTDNKQKACLFMDAESAVFIAGFLNWIECAQVFFAIPYEDDSSIFILTH